MEAFAAINGDLLQQMCRRIDTRFSFANVAVPLPAKNAPYLRGLKYVVRRRRRRRPAVLLRVQWVHFRIWLSGSLASGMCTIAALRWRGGRRPAGRFVLLGPVG